MHYRIGTRSSKLAVWQAEEVARQLQAHGHTTELVLFETKGDKQLAITIAKIGSKGVFTEELEQGLLAGELDLAVHSAKDLQSTMPAGLEIVAYGQREGAHDVVVGLTPDLDMHQPGLVVGSSSTRRRALLARHYPNAKVVEARGNLQTRFQKLRDGQFDVMLLAYAGVVRMGYESHIVAHLPIDTFVPPAGQGSVAVQCATSLAPAAKQAVVAACNHADSATAVLAERAFLAVLDGGCSIPVFAHATVANDVVSLHAGLISLDGSQLLAYHEQAKADESQTMAQNLASKVLTSGGKEMLAVIRGA